MITALRMDNSPVYSLLKFSLLSAVVSDKREERQAFLSPRHSKRDFLFPQHFCCVHLLNAWCCVRIMASDNVFYSKETAWLMITLFKKKTGRPHSESKQTIKCSQTHCIYYAYNHVRSMFSWSFCAELREISHRHKEKGEMETTFAVRLVILENVDAAPGYFLRKL